MKDTAKFSGPTAQRLETPLKEQGAGGGRGGRPMCCRGAWTGCTHLKATGTQRTGSAEAEKRGGTS